MIDLLIFRFGGCNPNLSNLNSNSHILLSDSAVQLCSVKIQSSNHDSFRDVHYSCETMTVTGLLTEHIVQGEVIKNAALKPW